MGEISQLVQLLQGSAPHTIAAFAIMAWMWERRDNRALRVKLLELATAQISSNLKHEAALDTIKTLVTVTHRPRGGDGGDPPCQTH